MEDNMEALLFSLRHQCPARGLASNRQKG